MGPSHAPARGSIVARAVARAILGVVVLIAVLIALWPTGVRGATPAPSPEPVDPFPSVQTWIDRPIEAPPDAPAGGLVQVGVTLWSDRNHALWPVDGLVIKLYPAKGKAAPSAVKATSDVQGHIVAQLPIPRGGAGRVEIVTTGQECAADGTCHDTDIPLRISGTGPPPDAPPGDLVTAELLPITGDVVAGRPATIAVNLRPIGLWDNEAFPLPDRIELTGTLPGGGRIAAGQLRQDRPGPGQPYRGSIRFPDPGQITLGAAYIDGSGRTQPISGEIGPILVIGTATGGGTGGATGGATGGGGSPRPTSTAGGAAAPVAGSSTGDQGPPWIVLGAIAVLVLGLVLFLGEPLTRRFRDGGDGDRR